MYLNMLSYEDWSLPIQSHDIQQMGTSNIDSSEEEKIDQEKKEQHSVLDYFTKVPSQVLVKCSSVMGEQAAHELADQTKIIMKKTTAEVSTSVSDAINQVVMTIDDLLDELAIYISKTVISGIGIRWGNAIISAIDKFGPSWEKALTGLGDNLAAIINRGFVNGMGKLVPQIGESVEHLSESISNFGKEEHAKVIREVFQREIFVSCLSVVMITLGVLMFAFSYLWKIGMFGILCNLIKNSTGICFLFCMLFLYGVNTLIVYTESKIYNSVVCLR